MLEFLKQTAIKCRNFFANRKRLVVISSISAVVVLAGIVTVAVYNTNTAEAKTAALAASSRTTMLRAESESRVALEIAVSEAASSSEAAVKAASEAASSSEAAATETSEAAKVSSKAATIASSTASSKAVSSKVTSSQSKKPSNPQQQAPSSQSPSTIVNPNFGAAGQNYAINQTSTIPLNNSGDYVITNISVYYCNNTNELDNLKISHDQKKIYVFCNTCTTFALNIEVQSQSTSNILTLKKTVLFY